MGEEIWIPIVLFVVTGLCVYSYLHFNHKNRNEIMAKKDPADALDLKKLKFLIS